MHRGLLLLYRWTYEYKVQRLFILQEFRRMSFSGYVLNGEQAGFYYMSLSRLHPQRIRETERLSESTASPPQQPAAATISCSAAAEAETTTLESEADAQADSEVRYISDCDVQRRENTSDQPSSVQLCIQFVFMLLLTSA